MNILTFPIIGTANLKNLSVEETGAWIRTHNPLFKACYNMLLSQHKRNSVDKKHLITYAKLEILAANFVHNTYK